MITELPLALDKRSSPCVWESHFEHEPWLSEYDKNGFYEFKSDRDLKTEQLNLDQIYSANRLGRVFESDGKTTRSQFNIHNDHPDVISNVLTKDMYHQTKLILGSEPLIYQSHINFKVSEFGQGYDWHSDYCYWRAHDGMLKPRALSVVIPFGDHNPTNGGLQLIRGSHNYFYPNTLSTQQSWQVNRIRHDTHEKEMESGIVPESIISEIPIENIVSLNMKLGDYAIFDANTWHSSSKNESHQHRTTLFLVLVSQQTPFDMTLKNYRPDYISCRKQILLSRYL